MTSNLVDFPAPFTSAVEEDAILDEEEEILDEEDTLETIVEDSDFAIEILESEWD